MDNAMKNNLQTSRQSGFSLIELLVALVFVSLLMAGLLQVFGASLSGFKSASANAGAQRTNRWALSLLEDDLQSAGYLFPVRTVTGSGVRLGAGAQEPFVILPARATQAVYPGPGGAGTVAENLNPAPDEVQFLMDVPLPITARLSGSMPDEATLPLQVDTGSLADLQAGDLAVVLDSNLEFGVVQAVVGNRVTLNTSAAVQQNAGGWGTSAGPGLSNWSLHQSQAEVLFVRPMQVVRYSIQPSAVDPADPAIRIPCLVREQTPYPIGGGAIDWTAAGIQRTVVAENVTGLRVDISVDGGLNWERGAAADWATIAARLNNRLAASYPATRLRSVTDPANPFWYRFIPVTLRLDLTTRSTQRVLQDVANSGAGPAYGFRERRQTLMITPRNFGLGLE